MLIVGFFVILDFMEKKSRNFKKWERFLKKDKDLSPDIDIGICAQLLANQEKFEKTINNVICNRMDFSNDIFIMFYMGHSWFRWSRKGRS